MTHLEIERKFLIIRPCEEMLMSMEGCIRHEILQTYLCSAPGVDERVRKRVTEGKVEYFHTLKEHRSPMVRTETESMIEETEYATLLKRADPAFRPLEKTRFCIPYAGQLLEIDVYPQLSEEAILEIELPSEETPVTLPPFLQVIREATGDKTYSNRRLAKRPEG